MLARDSDLACSLLEQHIRTTVEQAVTDVPGLIRGNARVLKPGKRRKN